jgi:DNA-binding MarR family transcriptional regulator
MTLYPGPDSSPGFLLWRVTLHWQRLVTEALRPFNLTHVQFALLSSAWWLSRDASGTSDGQGGRGGRGGPGGQGGGGHSPNQLAIAAQAGTNVKMTSEVLRKLEDKGLIVQQTDPGDRRAKSVTITPEGIRLAEQAVRAVEQVDAAFFSAAPPSIVGALQALARFDPG